MTSVTAEKIRKDIEAVLAKVADGGERVRITRRGRTIAAMVPVEDLKLLEAVIHQLEDMIDIREADKAMKEYERNGKSVSWEEVKKKYGL
jgi:prevent-host-death family protein